VKEANKAEKLTAKDYERCYW